MKKRSGGQKKTGSLKSGGGGGGAHSKGGSKPSGAAGLFSNQGKQGRSNESCSSSIERKGKKDNTVVAPLAPVQATSSLHAVNKASAMCVADVLTFDMAFPTDIGKATSDEIISSWNKRVLSRQAFRERSEANLYDEFEKLIKNKKLDSTLKKCTAFVKKMKQFPDSLKTSLESDLNSLNLTKYISEIALVIAQMKLKTNDLPSVLSICSEIHKRYPLFAEHLLENFEKVLPSKTTKLRNDKVLGEEKYNRKLRETKGEVPPDRQLSHDKLVASFQAYFDCVTKLADLLNLSTPKQRQLPSDPEDEFEKALLMNEDGEILTEVPGIVLFEDEETRQFYQDLPDLKTHLSTQKNSSGNCDSSPREASLHSDDDSTNESSSSSVSLSGDESDLEDVSGYGSNYDKDAEFLEDDSNSEGSSSEDLDDESLPSDEKDDKVGEMPKDDGSSNPSKPNIRKYLSSLKNCANKNMIDKAAYEFVDNFKSKHSKTELVSHFVAVTRQRMDLVNLYSRLIATISKVYPVIGKSVSERLLKDFRYLVLKRDQRKLEPKLKVTRFVAELTKFSVLPKSQTFNCLKLLLRNFTHHQIDMACYLIESCGGFLYRSLDSHRRMKLCLEEMLRRKSSQCLQPRYVYMVDSAYSQTCPSAEKSIQKKRKSPQQVFMEKVLCDDLSKQTLELANKVLRMFDWGNEERYIMAVNILSSPWNYSYAQLDSLAALLASLKQFRPTVTQAVIENISEQIRIGCENECEDINNLRTSTCQLFAHLYNYKNVSTTALLNVWYYMINYGVSYNINELSRMDPPDCLSRVRLICHMLKIAGDYLSSERSNKRLEFFLKYFQRYYLFKRSHPIWQSVRFPHNIQEFYEDSIKRVKKGWKFVQTVEEAEKEIAELDNKLRSKVLSDKLKLVIQNKSSVRIPVRITLKDKMNPPPSYAKVMAGSSLAKTKKIMEQSETEEPANINQGGAETHLSEKRLYNKAPYLLATVEEDDFEEAYATLCAESVLQPTENTRTPRLAPVEVPLAKMQTSSCSGMDANCSKPSVRVTVLTKQNNKPRMKTLEVPPEEEFLKNIKLREQAERKEKQEVKSRTLELARLQAEEDRKKEMPSIQDLLQKLMAAGKPNSTK
ncbi:Regulator of nonsense transcripts UPF2 [Orchesella cincta]|uniref:Regulator of nonsense transcripts UPF2 n=1 Tax=Orchesella cincta TaxID=48709 RepID=A0A1D2NHY6_ORCCI|nr:Regulator of nonsense transcripts UPF2 [Orchesella cincta]